MNIIPFLKHKFSSISLPSLWGGVWGWGFIFSVICLAGCKTVRKTQNDESGRNAVVQAQWRSAENLSSSSLRRLTALSFDSCALYFPPTRNTSEHSDTSAPLPDVSPSTGKAPKGKRASSTSISTAKPTSIFPSFNPSILKLYGLHLSQKVEEKSSMYQQEADSLAKAMQSSYAKAQNTQKESKHFLSFPLKLTFLIFIIGIILLVLRHFHARRK